MVVLSNLDRKKGLRLPSEVSGNLAEIVGIHFGDGYMQKENNYTYKIAYTLDVRWPEYVEYVCSLFNKTLGIKLKRYSYKDRNAINLSVHSKNLCEYFNKVLEIPYSPKSNLLIPSYILQNEYFLRRFIKGLFDTDGCFTVQRDRGYEYNLIKICAKGREFAEQVCAALSKLKIKSYICSKKSGYDVTIRRKESYSIFMNKINPEKKKTGATGI